MFRWLVTVRAADGRSPEVRQLLEATLVPLLRDQSVCANPELAACIHCAGEHTYLAQWPSEDAVVQFEHSPAYQAALDALAPLLRIPPKRELWEVLTAPNRPVGTGSA